MPVSGKKADLIKRVADNISDEDLIDYGVKRKYCLTEQGEKELLENEYVVYMHKTSNKTIETSNYKNDFNVWTINRILDIEDKENWKEVVNQQEKKIYDDMKKKHLNFMSELKKNNP